MTEPDRQLAVCPGCDLSLYQLKLGYASASRNTIYIYTDYNIPLKKNRMMTQSSKRQARMEGIFKRMKVFAFCAKFHEFLSICARALCGKRQEERQPPLPNLISICI